jgi:hypothetical protein
MQRSLLALALVCAPLPARADRYEATVTGDLHGGVARIGETGAAAAVVPAFGASVRLSHAWRDQLAWDVQLAGTLTQPATFKDAAMTVEGRPQVGDVTRRTTTVAAQLGAELRLGWTWVPTVRLALGPQVRHRGASDLGIFPDAVPAAVSLDGVASLGLGLDVRLGRRRVIGIALQVDHAQPLGDAASHDVLSVTLRLGHAWYPRWWAPAY